jgi:hypothetical protein
MPVSSDIPHPNSITILRQHVPLGGERLMIEAFNVWGQNRWPMSGDRLNYFGKVVFNYTVEPGQTQIATVVEFRIQRVAIAVIEADESKLDVTVASRN